MSAEPRGAARMVRVFLALLSADLVTRAMAALAAVIVVRALAPEAFGEVAFALAAGVLVGVVADLGLSVLLVRDVSEDPLGAPGLLGAALRLELTLGSIVFGAGSALALAGALPGPASGEALVLGLGVIAVNSLIRPFQATLAGYGRAHLVTAAHAIRGAALVAGTAVVAEADPAPTSFLGWALAAELIGLAAIAGLYRRGGLRVRLGVPWGDVLRLARRAIPFALLLVFGVLYLQLDLLMLGLIGTETDVGNYALAVRALEVAIAVPAFLGSAFLATVAQAGARGERVSAQTGTALRYALLLCLPLAFCLAVLADPLVELVAGEEYSDAAGILVRLSPILVLTSAFAVLANLQVARDRAALVASISLAAILVKVALNLWAIPRYGAQGAAVAAVAGEALIVVCQWSFARHDFDSRGTLRWCGRLGLAAAPMVALGIAGAQGLAWPLALGAGLAAFAAAALLLRCVSVGEVRTAVATARAGTGTGAAPASAAAGEGIGTG